MGWGTGGAGLHWYANWYRFHESDFKERTLFGTGLDWPIEYGDLRPYYDRAQRYFGVSGDLAAEPWALAANGRRELWRFSDRRGASRLLSPDRLRRFAAVHVGASC